MMTTLAKDLSPAEKNELVAASDAAIKSIHAYADWLEKRLPSMPAFAPMGEANYNYLLKTFICCRSMLSRSRCWARLNWRVIARWNQCCPILPGRSQSAAQPK